jgi:uncharacterized protein
LNVTADRQPGTARAATAEQHTLARSVLLHLAPGAALTAFVLLMHAAFAMEPLLALLIGIPAVIAPLELGYLALQAHRATGTWSPWGAVDYRNPVPIRRLLLLASGLAAWMLFLTAVSLTMLDEVIADTVFRWLPDVLLQMATVTDDGEPMSAATLVAFLLLFFLSNGLIGPVTEELYFRGHLLPRIDRYGAGAPVLNTALFTLYHFHNPWRYPAILLGYLPIAWASWRRRSMWVGLAAHVIVNNVFVLMFLASYLDGQ